MKMKRLISLLLAAVMLAGLALAEEDPVLVTVNGTAITRSQAMATYQDIVDYYSENGYDMTDEASTAVARGMALNYKLQELAISHLIEEKGLNVISPEDLAALEQQNNEMWENAISEYIQYEANLAEDASEDDKAAARLAAIAYFESLGYTMESTLETAKENWTYDQLLASFVSEDSLADADIEAAWQQAAAEETEYYSNAMMYEFAMYLYGVTPKYRPEGYRSVLRILLVPPEDVLDAYVELNASWEEQAQAIETGATPTDIAEGQIAYEQVEAAQAEVIAAVQDKLDAIYAAFEAGTPFIDLVDQYSEETTLKEEPMRSEDLPVHPESIIYDAAFVQGAISIENPGEISKPVVGQEGVYVIYYLNDLLGGVLPMTDADREEMRASLLDEKRSEALQAAVDAWLAGSEVVYTEEGETWKYVPPAETTPVQNQGGQQNNQGGNDQSGEQGGDQSEQPEQPDQPATQTDLEPTDPEPTNPEPTDPENPDQPEEITTPTDAEANP